MKALLPIFAVILFLSTLVSTQCPDSDWNGLLWSTKNYAQNVSITISAAESILYDVSDFTVTNLIIYGTLVFKNQPASLTANYILVQPSGALIMGNEAAGCQISNKITITLTGPRSAANTMGVNPSDGATLGDKGIAVMSNSTNGGTLSIHGKVNAPSFTRLSVNVAAGSDSIIVDDAVSWQVGDSIVITSTDYSQVFDYSSNYSRSFPSINYAEGFGSPDQSEQVVITAISGNTITFTPALKYLHWGSDYEKAEVGLLTRYIVINGDASSDNSLFGGHVIIRSATLAQVSGVEFTRMGQLGTLGRYPLHFHLLFGYSIGRGFYAIANSFHHNYQRCLTIHGTSGINIRENVAYDTYGHCYFLEDGAEEVNTFHHNLGVTARPVPSEGFNGIFPVIPTDIQPAIFWITNVNNTFTENVAVGGRFGYWFALPATPTGPSALVYPSATSNLRPRMQPLLQFDYNIAHSCMENGLEIDQMPDINLQVDLESYTPYNGPYVVNGTLLANYYLTPAEAKINGFIAYKNRNYGIWSRGAFTHYVNCTLLDNRIQYNNPPAGPSLLEDSILWGETNNPGTPRNSREVGRQGPDNWLNPYVLTGMETYDNGGPQYVRNIQVYNITSIQPNRPAGCFGPLFNGPFGHQTRNRYYQIHFDSASNPNRVWANDSYNDGPKCFTVYNTDTSVVGSQFPNGGWILANNPPGQIMLAPNASDCTFMSDWNAYVCPPFGEGYIQLQFLITNMPAFASQAGGVTASIFNLTYIQEQYAGIHRASFYNMETKVEHPVAGRIEDDNVGYNFDVNLVPRRAYTVRFANKSVTPSNLQLSMQSSVGGDWMIFVIPYPTNAAPFTITYKNYYSSLVTTLTSVASTSALKQGTYYFDSSAGNLYLWMENTGLNSWSTWWNLTDYSYDGGVYSITAGGCGSYACGALTSGNQNSIPSAPSIVATREDTYRSDLVPPCNNNPNDGSQGAMWVYFNPTTKAASIAIYHNIDPSTISNIEIVDMAHNDRLIADLSETTSSPVRRVIALSHTSWLSLAQGKLLATITYSGGRKVGGVLGCESITDCTIPYPVLDPITCVDKQISKSLVNQPVFLDGPLPGWPRWTSWSWNNTGDQHPTYLDFNNTDAVLCGNNSMLLGLQNGALALGYSGYPAANVSAFTVNPTATPYFQFWAKTKEPSTNVVFGIGFTDSVKSYGYIAASPAYVLNYVVEETSWTRVQVPLSLFNFTSTTSQVIQSVRIVQYPGWGNDYVEVYIDDIVFTNGKDGANYTNSFTNFALYTPTTTCTNGVSDALFGTGSGATLEFGYIFRMLFYVLSYIL